MQFTTCLFVPGDRPERFAKAFGAGAGCVVLDLEDAVSPARKSAAREAVAATLSNAGVQACVRLNGIDTPEFEEDLRLLALPGAVAAMLPKAEGADALAAVRAACRPGTMLLPIIETARGLAAATTLAACEGVRHLAFGSVDFQVDLGIEGDGVELLFARSQLVFSSRLAAIAAPIDGVTLAVKDLEVLRRDAWSARRLGFAGKLCIHPDQVAPVREVFMPGAQELAWARGVLAAAEATGGNATTYEGKLVDKPVIDKARSILLRANA